jgi:hypothetical protein
MAAGIKAKAFRDMKSKIKKDTQAAQAAVRGKTTGKSTNPS